MRFSNHGEDLCDLSVEALNCTDTQAWYISERADGQDPELRIDWGYAGALSDGSLARSAPR